MEHLFDLVRKPTSPMDWFLLAWSIVVLGFIAWNGFVLVFGLGYEAISWFRELEGGWKEKLGQALGQGLISIFALSVALLIIWVGFLIIKAVLNPVTFVLAGIALGLFLLIKLMARPSQPDADTLDSLDVDTD